MFYVLLMYALFSSTFTVGKVTLNAVDPFFLTGVRMLFAALLLFAFLLWRNKSTLRLPRKLMPHIVLLGIFNVFITNAFEYWALQYLETGKASLIYSFSPLFAILLSYLFFKEKMRLKKWLALAVGMAGFSLIFIAPGSEGKLQGSISLAEIAISISACTAVIGWMIMKRVISTYNYSLLAANAYSFIVGGCLSLTTSLFLEPWHPVPVSAFTPFLLGMLYIAIVHNTICYTIYSWSLKRFSVPFMSFAGFSCPLFTAAFGWLFLKESVTLYFFLSLTLIIAGIALYSHDELKAPPDKIDA